MDEPSRWAAYFYPPPDDRTLRNLEGYRDAHALRVFEYAATELRRKQLAADLALVARTFDAAHVRAIHRQLFQDVYEWAGEYRTVDMFKKGASSAFASVLNGDVDRYLALTAAVVARADWGRLGRDEFAVAAAVTFAHLNHAHPFREGNGRTAKEFMRHVADRSQFALEFERVDRFTWNLASELSRPLPGERAPRPENIVQVFQEVTVDRPGTRTISPEMEALRLRGVSYSQGASAALGPVQADPSISAKPYGTVRGYGGPERGVGR